MQFILSDLMLYQSDGCSCVLSHVSAIKHCNLVVFLAKIDLEKDVFQTADNGG